MRRCGICGCDITHMAPYAKRCGSKECMKIYNREYNKKQKQFAKEERELELEPIPANKIESKWLDRNLQFGINNSSPTRCI
jgi:hypothetical protein